MENSTEKKNGLKTLDVALGSFKETLIFFNFWVGGPFSAGILVQKVCKVSVFSIQGPEPLSHPLHFDFDKGALVLVRIQN